jgi:actin related protein 2/3 complex subunit 5
LKERSASLVLKVLTSFKTAEIEGAVNALKSKELAILLHYVFKAFEIINDSQASQQLCAWHAQIFSAGGHGVINQIFASPFRL